jgi:hypothetical protein
MNATGTKTAHNTRPMVTTGPTLPSSPGRGVDRVHAVLDVMLHGSTTTMASSTTMPMASNEAEHGQHVHAEAQHGER